MKRKILIEVGLVFVLLVTFGCGARPIHPGSANQFDSQSYDVVFTAHNVIESTKTSLANNEFPAGIVPNVKKALNDLIAAYNIADQAYLAYHNAAIAGTSTQAQMDAVNASQIGLNTATRSLVTAKGGQ